MTADIKNINCNLEKFETIKTIVVALGLYEQFDDMGAKEVGNKITPSYRKPGTWMNGAGIFYQIQKNEDKRTTVEQIARSDRQPQYEKESMEYIEKHLRHFCKVYMR